MKIRYSSKTDFPVYCYAFDSLLALVTKSESRRPVCPIVTLASMKCRTSEFQRVWSVSRRLDVIFFFRRALESKLRFCPCGRGKWEKVCSKWYPSVLLGLGFILSAVGERLVPSRYMYSLSCCGDGAFVCRGTDAGKGVLLLLSLALSHTYSQALPHPFGCCELARNVLVTLNGNSMLYVRHVLL